MSSKLSVEEVAETVEASSLTEAILNEIHPESIGSSLLAGKWRRARALLTDINEILEGEHDPDEHEDDDDPVDDEDGEDDDEEPGVDEPYSYDD